MSSSLISIKFFQEDTVKEKNGSRDGVVVRCWHDGEDQLDSEEDPTMAPLQPGQLTVQWHTGQREIRIENDLELIDRAFQAGDLCKRTFEDDRSGVVISIDVLGILAHAVSNERIEGWTSMSQVQSASNIDIADYVTHGQWVGQVIELFDVALIETTSGQIKSIGELGTRLTVGDMASNLPPAPPSLFGFLMRKNQGLDVVVDVKHTCVAVTWLAINQSIAPNAADLNRPKRFWFGESLSELMILRNKSDQDFRLGDKVIFKPSYTGKIPSTSHGASSLNTPPLEVRVFQVRETRTDVNVLWQDGTTEKIPATQLIPYLNPDEQDIWPADHVIWTGDGQKRPAVVQSVDATARTATIRYSDTGKTELTSLLELDAHGLSQSALDPHMQGLGVRRGDFVFIHREGTNNGCIEQLPRVPRIGEIEEWVREVPISEDASLAGWRKELNELGIHLATHQLIEQHDDSRISRITGPNPDFRWFGEVTGLRLDGLVQVMFSDKTVGCCPLERITRLYDGIEQLDDWHGSEDENSDGDWEMDQDIDEPMLSTDIDTTPGWADDDETIEPETTEPETVELSLAVPGPSSPPIFAESIISDDNEHMERFRIMPSAPVDHAFYSSIPPTQTPKTFLSRLSKEYRVLSTSLPETIMVRAYEDRTDLLRSIIIGPPGTPYADCPFIIDWKLTDFPENPPVAHFHSWTNGNGRINPNLYEDGKICLSILGTWQGQESCESWSAARSSLLQALVSIQGLVLTKDPWFCEPAYEKLRSTEAAVVNSRLYSEKAYVLARGFVRHALETPIGSFEDEITWIYFENRGLEKILRDARLLIEKSSQPEVTDLDESMIAVPRLSQGAIITLNRTLERLEFLLDNWTRTHA